MREVDVALYILDITRLGQVDEAEYLSRFVATRPDLLAAGRMLFIFNKIDVADYDDNIIRRAKDYMRKFVCDIDPKLADIAEKNTLAIYTGSFIYSLQALENKLHVAEQITLVKKWLYGSRVPKGPLSYPLNATQRENLEAIMQDSRFLQMEEPLCHSLTINAPRFFATVVVGNLSRICSELRKEVALKHTLWQQGLEKSQEIVKALKKGQGAAEEFIAKLQDDASSEQRHFQDFGSGQGCDGEHSASEDPGLRQFFQVAGISLRYF